MLQFPNYYPQMNNYNSLNPNLYMDRATQLQQYQQSLQQPVAGTQMSLANQMTALGKIVDSIDVVKATDIPMDGNAYYFPKADGTEVYCKQWLQNGTTRILTFKPILDSEPNNISVTDEKLKILLSDELTSTFMKRFDAIEKRLDNFLPKANNKMTTSKTKKEDDAV